MALGSPPSGRVYWRDIALLVAIIVLGAVLARVGLWAVLTCC